MQWTLARFRVRRMMVVIAILGTIMGAVRFYFLNIDPFHGFGTIYSARYSERRFNRLRVGMTREKVEAVMGAPLDKIPWDAYEDWWYSVPPHYEANYWRRWVIFEKGKVVLVISDFWIN